MTNTRISSRVLDRVDLGRRIAAVIRQAIFEQRLKPGDRIRETQLSKELNVSRTPIREALRYLEQEGLVQRNSFHSAYVSSMSESDMRKAFRIRAVLEALALEDARPHLKPSDRNALEKYLEAMRSAAKEHNLSDFNRNDMSFHKYIWKLSGDEILERHLNYLCHTTFVVYNLQTLALLTQRELMNLVDTHKEVISILESDNGDPFERLQTIQNQWLSLMIKKLFPKMAPVRD